MNRTKLILAAVALVLVGGLAVALNPRSPESVTHVQKISLDHKMYASAKELKDDSDLIVRGTVLDNGRTVDGQPLHTEDGKEVPGTPTTEFGVKVVKTFKGTTAANEITVVLTGGVSGDTRFEAEGMPWLAKQATTILYLHLGEDGKYYPMAGGAAIAAQKAGKPDKFTLPAEVNGSSAIDISESDL